MADSSAQKDRLSQLAAALLTLVKQRHLEVNAIESCTGGLLASVLNDVEGLSHVFNRALITYSDVAKTELARVPDCSDSQGF